MMMPTGKEKVIYDLSRQLVGNETRNPALGPQDLLSANPGNLEVLTLRARPSTAPFAKNSFKRPALGGREAWWLFILSKFNIKDVTQKTLKGEQWPIIWSWCQVSISQVQDSSTISLMKRLRIQSKNLWTIWCSSAAPAKEVAMGKSSFRPMVLTSQFLS